MDDPIKDYKEWGEKQYPPAKFTADNFPTFFKPHRIFLVIEGAMALIGGGLFVAGKEYYIALPFFVIAIGLFIRAIKFKKPNEPLQ